MGLWARAVVLRRLSACFAVVLCAGICRAAQAAKPAVDKGSWGRVIGYVLDITNRQPVRDAVIAVEVDGKFPDQGKATGKTDATGRYSVEAKLGTIKSKVDVGRLLTSSLIVAVLSPRSVTKETKQVDVSQLRLRIRKEGFKPFLGRVTCAAIATNRYTVYEDDVLMAPAGSEYASCAPDNCRRERVEEFKVEPSVVQPGRRVTITAKLQLPREPEVSYKLSAKSLRGGLSSKPIELRRSGDAKQPGTYSAVVSISKKPKWEADEVALEVVRDGTIVPTADVGPQLVQVASASQGEAARMCAQAWAGLRAGDLEAARAAADSATVADASRAFAFELWGEVCWKLHRNSESVSAYRRLAELHPKDEGYYQALYGHALVSDGKPEEARAAMEAVEKRVKRPAPEIFSVLARCDMAKGDIKGADAFLTKAAKGSFLSTELQLQMSLERAQAGLAAAPQSPDSHLGMACALEAAGRTTEAAAEYRQALGLDPGSAWSYLDLGRLLMKQGQPATAAPYLEQAVARNDKSVEAKIGLGDCCLRLGMYSEAVAQYEPLAKVRKADFEVHHGYGLALLGSGQEDKAIEALQHGLAYARGKGNVRDVGTYTGLGSVWYSGPKSTLITGFNCRKAVLDYVILDSIDALQKSPDNLPALADLGAALTELGLPDLALVHLNKCLESDPSMIEAKHARALAYLAQGKTAEASADLQEVIKADPLHPHAYLVLARMLSEGGEIEQAQALILRHQQNYPFEKEGAQLKANQR